MSPNRKRRLSAGTSRSKLRAATGATCETAGARVLRWWQRGFRKSSFSAIYGLFLVLPAVVLTATFFNTVSRATAGEAFWKTDVFGYFAVGAAVWTLWFFGSIWSLGAPQPLHAYVFGHELTHAIWVWLWRGRVYDKKMWSSDGGYIITDTTNFAFTPGFQEVFLGNSPKPRLSIGIGVNWVSPFGPLRLDLAKALLKQEGDDTKLFSFNVGTSF